MPRNATPPIHPQLIERANWLLRRVKVPYYISGSKRTGTLDSAADIRRLATYADAVAALATGTYDGLGLAINQGIQFIDLDHCYEDGKLKPRFTRIVQAAKKLGAFAEVSISGNGLHIFGLGAEMTTRKLKDKATDEGLEIYTGKRYSAMGTPVWRGAKELPDLSALQPLLDELAVTIKPKLKLVSDRPAPGSTRVPLTWSENAKTARRLLRQIPADATYDDWLAVGQALHDASNGDASGLKLWDTWSQQGEKYKEGECASKWQGFHRGGGIRFGTLVHLAETYVASEEYEAEAEAEERVRRPGTNGNDLLHGTVTPVPWLIEGLLPPGLTLLAAPPKTGKSYLMLQASMSMATGIPFLGLKTRKSRVMYLNFEEWDDVLKPRVQTMAKHLGITNLEGLQVEYELPHETLALDFVQQTFDEGYEVVVVDIFARVRGELEEDTKANAYARDYKAVERWATLAVRNPGRSIVLVHHGNKGQHENWQDKISGSNGVAGATHTNFMLTKLSERNIEAELLDKVRRYRKLAYAGKQIEERELLLKQQDGVWVMSDDTEDDVRASLKQQQVLTILRATPSQWVPGKTLITLLEDNEKPSATRVNAWYRIMRRMVVKGMIDSDAQHGYRLLARG